MALEITDANLKKVLAENEVVVIDFWAEWCGPCKMVGPVVEEIANEYKGKAVIGKCNVDNNTETPTEFGIRNIPTLLFFKGGKLVDKMVGANQKAAIVAKLEKLF
ncbi:MAG: thioredoxin [Bacteroidaceae bacterium]